MTDPILPVEVILGTYEQFLVGYQLKADQNNKWKFEQSFTDHAHSGSIRAVAASSDLIASGGTDEVVRIFSAKKRVDVGTLFQHQGTITHIAFFQDTHMFTSSADGTICVWDTRNWECLKTLRGHKGSVLSFSVHPSGKMLLSVSKDKTLRTWNLIKGRLAYITNLKKVAHLVTWSPQGTHFLIAIDDHVDVYNVAIGGVVKTFKFEEGKRINCMEFLSDHILAVSGDSEFIQFFDLETESNSSITRFRAHNNRVKSLFSTFNRVNGSNSEAENRETYLFSVSSDCFVKLWKVNEVDEEPTLICSVDSTCRPTAFAVLIPKGEENIFSESRETALKVRAISPSSIGTVKRKSAGVETKTRKKKLAKYSSQNNE